MNVLIVENKAALAQLWANHIMRQGAFVDIACCEVKAIDILQETGFDIVVLNLDLAQGSALAISDFACYRHPDCKVIYVTSSSFFSDGTVFHYMRNACALLPVQVPPEDMAALIEHHAP